MAAEQHDVADILLEYRREDGRSTGRLLTLYAGKPHNLETFEKVEYRNLLTRLARVLASTPLARVVITRTDAPNLFPYVLDKGTVDLFRTDPVAAIHSMIYELPEARMEKKTEDEAVEVAPLRVGYNTLADAFGDDVYVRTRQHSIECPGCGLWGDADVDGKGKGKFTCKRSCELSVPIYLYRLWAAISVEELLGTQQKRFFLPRPWNDGHPWVTREELEKKYAAYKAEKEEACSQQRMV